MNRVVIDNLIVTKLGNGVQIRSINMERKINPNFVLENIHKISYGSKKEDNNIISLLCNGTLKFEDLELTNN